MNKFKAMTKLHRQSDHLIDSASSATLSKGDAKFVNEFLLLERTEQLSIIRFGIRGIHPEYVDELCPVSQPCLPHPEDVEPVGSHDSPCVVAEPVVKRFLVLVENLIDPKLMNHVSLTSQ